MQNRKNYPKLDKTDPPPWKHWIVQSHSPPQWFLWFYNRLKLCGAGRCLRFYYLKRQLVARPDPTLTSYVVELLSFRSFLSGRSAEESGSELVCKIDNITIVTLTGVFIIYACSTLMLFTRATVNTTPVEEKCMSKQNWESPQKERSVLIMYFWTEMPANVEIVYSCKVNNI